MPKIERFGIIGGDKRQLETGISIQKDGYNVNICGFENANFIVNNLKQDTLYNVINNSDGIILPLPITRDGKTINAPFSSNEISLNNEFFDLIKNKKVFCGMAETLFKYNLQYNNNNIYDYFAREEFAVENAVPTAEGAIEIAMREYNGTINGSKCLITGYGRIGKVLAHLLKGLGAVVTVSARKKEDEAWITLQGYKFAKTSSLPEEHFDIIFNTIPSIVFDARTLAKTAINSILIDLASAPYGVDYNSAERLGINTIKALSLPGKVAPKTAGEIIKNTIYNIIEEET